MVTFKNKIIRMGYEPTKVEGVYKYYHTHGEQVIYFYSDDTIYIYWKPEDEKKKILYYGYIPETANEIRVIIKLLRLDLR